MFAVFYTKHKEFMTFTLFAFSTFYLTNLVTNSQWHEFTDATGHTPNPMWQDAEGNQLEEPTPEQAEAPVVYVTFDEVEEFVIWLRATQYEYASVALEEQLNEAGATVTRDGWEIVDSVLSDSNEAPIYCQYGGEGNCQPMNNGAWSGNTSFRISLPLEGQESAWKAAPSLRALLPHRPRGE